MRKSGEDWEGVETNFNNVYKFQKQVDPPVLIDSTYGNFMLSTEGNIVFVDTLRHKRMLAQKPIWDVTRVKNFMEEHKYKDTEIRGVLKSINRLVDLGFAENKDT